MSAKTAAIVVVAGIAGVVLVGVLVGRAAKAAAENAAANDPFKVLDER